MQVVNEAFSKWRIQINADVEARNIYQVFGEKYDLIFQVDAP